MQCLKRRKQGFGLTLSIAIYDDLMEVYLLGMWTEGISNIAEEIFPGLGLSGLLGVLRIAIYTAARFVELDDGHRVAKANCMSGEASGHVAIQSFRTEDNQDVDCFASVSNSHKQDENRMRYQKILRRHDGLYHSRPCLN